ncbi:MAG: YhgE/Pip domain-containing protein [Clostridium sp.]|uniref:YhgE/Pip family protein n=1 Tax=Clostridium sp. TaxID=1506 RepID=UPI0039EC0BAE
MNFLKITSRDIKKIFKNRFIGISVVAIIITPLFYSLFYLSSFWDPYGNLQNMPVAVVNLDKGTINDGKNVNYGGDLVNELKKNDDVGWRFVSQSDADNGLTGNKYYGEVVIPVDFSEKALSAKSGVPEKPNIVFKDNPKKNYIATKIYSSVKTNLDDKITKTLVNEYTKVTFDNLYDVKDGMNQAVDGSSKLANGILSVKDGSNQLTSGVLSLMGGSNQLKNGLATAVDGSSQLKTGIASANDGSGQLKTGLQQLNSKIPELQNGVLDLFNGSNQLVSGIGISNPDDSSKLIGGINKLTTGIRTAQDGISTLNNGLISESTGVSEVGGAIGILNNKINGQNGLVPSINQLGGAIGTLNTEVNVGGNGQPSLVDGITNGDPQKGLGSAVQKINDSINGDDGLVNESKNVNSNLDSLKTLAVGLNGAIQDKQLQGLISEYRNSSTSDSKKLQIGANLVSTMNELLNNELSLNNGVIAVSNVNENIASRINDLGRASEGLNTKVNGQNGLVSNINQLGGSIGTLNAKVNVGGNGQPSLVDGITNKDPQKGLASAVGALNTAVNIGINDKPSLVTGMQQLKDGTTNNLVPGIGELFDGSNSILSGANAIGNGALQLNNGLNNLSNSTPTLSSGITQLYNGASTLNDGTNKLYTGTSDLNNGINKLYNGAVSLNDGTSKLYDGANGLQDGTNKLYDGSKELSDKLSSGAEDLNKNLKNSSTTMGNFVSQPINVETEHLFADETYGVALAPYFIPISIWVGAILMFFVVSDEVDEDIKAKAKSIVMGKYLVYIGIGALQAICVSTAVLFIGIRPSNLFVFYLFNIFISFVFISIIQCLIFLLKDVGRLLGIILLVLQLASSAGTFPIELSPKFYRVISPFMPFTYVVSGLREVINGINYSVLGKDIAFLVFVFIIFFTLSLTFRGKVIKFHEIIEEKKNESVA